MEEEIKKEETIQELKVKKCKYFLVGFCALFIVSLSGFGYYFKRTFDNKSEIGHLKDEISEIAKERNYLKVLNQNAEFAASIQRAEVGDMNRKLIEERRIKVKNVYKNDEYNFLFYYVGYLIESDLGVFVSNKDNVIEIFRPAEKKYQDGEACGNKEKCIVIQNNKYFREPEKITVINEKYQNIEQAVSSLLREKNFDMDNCLLEIEDYKYGKKVRLKLSDEMRVKEEDIKRWEDENGSMDGAFSADNIVSSKKTEQLCSEYGQPEMPVDRFFVFNEDRKDIFLFYESNNAERNSLIYPDSIQLLY